MDDQQLYSQEYQRIEEAIRFLNANFQRQPELEAVAAHVGLSEYHFQRLFTHWVGISPKRFLQFVTREGAKQLLADSHSLLDTTYEVGLSSPGRLHDLFIVTEAVTPGEYKARGAGLSIAYGFHPSLFGECLLGVTGRGICYLGFTTGLGRQAALDEVRSQWPHAQLSESIDLTAPLMERVFAPRAEALPVHLNGSNFQIKVWEALLRIPPGAVACYQDIAGVLGMPPGQPRRGQCDRAQPGVVSHPLSSCAAQDGRIWQLSPRH